MIKKLVRGFFILIITLLDAEENKTTFSFQEIWAYVMRGEEKYLSSSMNQITDLCYFSATLSETGRLKEPLPDINQIPASFRNKARIHLVVSSIGNVSITYWALHKDPDTRQNLIEEILEAAKPYDGLQIDFESIRKQESEAYWSFLREIRGRLPKEKVLSVAVPARLKNTEDPFNYKEIASIANKVIVMAYDEHWRTGTPGAIASLKWCEKVASYARQAIPTHKFVMGIPLYGRVWQKQEVACSLKYFQTLELWKLHPNALKRETDETPYFEFKQPVDAVVYFEDVQSLGKKLAYYQESGIPSVALWRVSQEPAALWNQLLRK